jgi:hypothetical protein
MIMKNSNKTFFAVVLLVTISACTKADYGDDFKTAPPPPIGSYNNSDEVAAEHLAAKWTFDNSLTETIHNLNGTATGTSFVTGIKGDALQGSPSGYVVYENAGPQLPGLTSFTVSFWMKTDQFADGATQLFQLENTGDFWSNMTVYFEATTENKVRYRMQFHSEGATWNNAFIEAALPNASNFLGKWTHVTSTYDASTSKYRVYLNSSKVHEEEPKAGPDGPGLGPLAFINPGRLIFGTWKQKIGAPGDTWMQNYKGAVDEFRIYNKALTDIEISALYRFEKQGQ